MNCLFLNQDSSGFFDAIKQSVVRDIESLTLNNFESNSLNQIEDHIGSKHLLRPIKLIEEEKEIYLDDPMSVTAGIECWSSRSGSSLPSYKLTWSIPFSGTADLLKFRPSTYNTRGVRAMVSEGSDKIIMSVDALQNEQKDIGELQLELESKMEEELKHLKAWIANVNTDVSTRNRMLKDLITSNVAKKKDELERFQKLEEALKVNVQPKDGITPPTYKIDIPIITLSNRKTDKGAHIDDKAYEGALQVIRNMAATIESTRAAESKDEEGLRDILLVGLNGCLQTGSAVGELFRKIGKTDIAILHENNAAFVAECKLWRGEKYAKDGLNQLLGYLTWRDAKTALILFNRDNKNFSSIQGQIESIFCNHEGYMRSYQAPEGEWQFLFKKPDDEGRFIRVHVFLIDIHDVK